MDDEYRSLIVSSVQWITNQTMEIAFERPGEWTFRPGQKVILKRGELFREYSLISTPKEPELRLLVQHVSEGKFSSLLARLSVGDHLWVSSPRGYFSYQSHGSNAVFVATGTGVAPFISFTGSGVAGFLLLHGVRFMDQLYYREVLEKSAEKYIPCISGGIGEQESRGDLFQGWVTTYIDTELPMGEYDFYLCGSGEMIGDVIGIIDSRFPESRIFTESFY